MGIGDILSQIDTAGSVTAPAKYPLTLGSVEAERLFDAIPCHAASIPGLHALAITNGIDPMRIVVKDDFLRLGLLPPGSAMTATPNGAVQASATLDLDADGAGGSAEYTIADGDIVTIAGIPIKFVTSLGFNTDSPGYHEVKIGASNSEALDNLKSLAERTAGEGSTYFFHASWGWLDSLLEVTTKTASTIKFSHLVYGSSGNSTAAFLGNNTQTGSGWSNVSFGSQGTTVDTIGYLTGGSDGTSTGDGPPKGNLRYAQSYLRTKDGAESAIGDYVEVELGAILDVDLAAMTASSDADVDYTRWWRTLKDGHAFYRGEDILDSGTTDTDNLSDTNLTDFGSIRYNANNHRPYGAGFPPKYRFCVRHLGRLFGAGSVPAAEYGGNAVSWTNDSASATITATTVANGIPTQRWVGREIAPDSGNYQNQPKLIVAVDETVDPVVLTLSTKWKGPTGTTAYTVRDARDPTEIGWSAPNKPNQWPVTNTLLGVTSEHPEGITAMRSWNEMLVIWCRDSLWVLIGDNPGSFQLRRVSSDGCVSHKAVVETDSHLYWLGPDGVYRWAADGDPTRISNPNGRTGIHETIKRVNEAHSHWVSGAWNVTENSIIWAVPLDDDVTCRHGFVFDLHSHAFTVDTLADITSLEVVVGADGERYHLAGSVEGDLIQSCVSNSDGCYGVEPVQTVDSGATTRSVPLTGSPSLPDLTGVPGLLITAAGEFIRFKVGSNTTDTVTPVRHLDSAPSSGDKVIFGAIHAQIRTGKFNLNAAMVEKNLAVLDVAFAPDSDGSYFVAACADQGTLTIPEFGDAKGDLTDTIGHAAHDVNETGRELQWEIHAFEPGCDPTFLAAEMGITAWRRERQGV